MKNKVVKVAAATLVATTAFGVASHADTQEKVNIERISGANRFETAFKIAEKMKSDTAFVVDGKNYADALAVGPIAYSKGYPIILADDAAALKSRISKSEIKKIIIVGGYSSVSKEVEDTLKESFNVNRIQGKNRYETSKKLADFVGVKNVGVATGRNYPDALAAGPLLGNRNLPLLLIDGRTENTLPDGFVGNYTIGGENSVRHTFGKRISGKDRYETSANIAKELGKKNIIIASGENFADALAAAPLAKQNNASIVLAQKEKVNDAVKALAKDAEKITIVGGESSVSDAVKNVLSVKNSKEDEVTTSYNRGGGGSSYRHDPIAKKEDVQRVKKDLKEYMGSIDKNYLDNIWINTEENKENMKKLKGLINDAEALLQKDDTKITVKDLEKIKSLMPKKVIKDGKEVTERGEIGKTIKDGRMTVDMKVIGERTEKNNNPSNTKLYTVLDNKTKEIKILSKAQGLRKTGDATITINYVLDKDYNDKNLKVDVNSGATPRYKKSALEPSLYDLTFKDNGDNTLTYIIKIKGDLPQGTKILKPVIKIKASSDAKFENGDLVFVKEDVPVVEKVDKTELNKSIEEAEAEKSNVKYTKATEEKKKAFDTALENAKNVKSKESPTKEEVKNAKEALEKATKELDGKEVTPSPNPGIEPGKEEPGKKDPVTPSPNPGTEPGKEEPGKKDPQDPNKGKEDEETPGTGGVIKDDENEKYLKEIEGITAIRIEAFKNDDSALEPNDDLEYELEKGQSYKLKSTGVLKSNKTKIIDSKNMIWILEGNNSKDTKVDKNGILTIGEDESSKNLTIKAETKARKTNGDFVDQNNAALKNEAAFVIKDSSSKTDEPLNPGTEPGKEEPVKPTPDPGKNPEVPVVEKVDKTELNKSIEEAEAEKSNVKYTKATEEKKNAFDTALENAKKVKDKEAPTKEEVKNAKEDLEKATKELDGKEVTPSPNPGTEPGKEEPGKKDPQDPNKGKEDEKTPVTPGKEDEETPEEQENEDKEVRNPNTIEDSEPEEPISIVKNIEGGEPGFIIKDKLLRDKLTSVVVDSKTFNRGDINIDEKTGKIVLPEMPNINGGSISFVFDGRTVTVKNYNSSFDKYEIEDKNAHKGGKFFKKVETSDGVIKLYFNDNYKNKIWDLKNVDIDGKKYSAAKNAFDIGQDEYSYNSGEITIKSFALKEKKEVTITIKTNAGTFTAKINATNVLEDSKK